MAITAAVEITDEQDFQELLEEYAENKPVDQLPPVFHNEDENTYQVVLSLASVVYSVRHWNEDSMLSQPLGAKGYRVLEGKINAVTL